MKYLLLDLDGTLCDHSWRIHYAKKRNWDKYNSLCKDDKPNDPVYRLILDIQNNYSIIILTGREEKYRSQTVDWLNHHGVKFCHLFMRPNGEYKKPDYQLKIEWIKKIFGGEIKEHIAFALEDRNQVVNAYRKIGIPVFQVNEDETGAYKP